MLGVPMDGRIDDAWMFVCYSTVTVPMVRVIMFYALLMLSFRLQSLTVYFQEALL
jgi:hypothetical protein